LKYTFFVLLKATPQWLRLTREERGALADEHLVAVLSQMPQLTMRHFDAEAFTTVCSDVMMIETPDPRQYYFFIEKLRDSPLVTTPYFEIVQIIPAIEDGYRAYEEADETTN
jgi:hypothetical protein